MPESEIDSAQYDSLDVTQQAYRSLTCWQRTAGSNATLETLRQALVELQWGPFVDSKCLTDLFSSCKLR